MIICSSETFAACTCGGNRNKTMKQQAMCIQPSDTGSSLNLMVISKQCACLRTVLWLSAELQDRL